MDADGIGWVLSTATITSVWQSHDWVDASHEPVVDIVVLEAE